MTKILLHTLISAPIQVCFDLARDAEFHVETARETGERIVSGKSSGLFEVGDEVVFEGRHLGIKQRLGASIIAMDAPNSFTDEMTSGIFQSLRHLHQFETLPSGQTRMTDHLEWRSPLGILGVIADKITVESHLRRFLEKRGQRIKQRAEAHTSTL